MGRVSLCYSIAVDTLPVPVWTKLDGVARV